MFWRATGHVLEYVGTLDTSRIGLESRELQRTKGESILWLGRRSCNSTPAACAPPEHHIPRLARTTSRAQHARAPGYGTPAPSLPTAGCRPFSNIAETQAFDFVSLTKTRCQYTMLVRTDLRAEASNNASNFTWAVLCTTSNIYYDMYMCWRALRIRLSEIRA